MTRVYLVRHGVHGLVDKALAGRTPGVHLIDEGQAQAQRLATFFAGRDVTTVLSSPLERCRETAAPIADRLSLPVEISHDLIELDCGEWTGLAFDALHADPRWVGWNSERGTARMPGGDSMGDVCARIMRVLDGLAAKDREAAVLVSHSDVIKAAVQTLLGSPLDRHDRLTIDPASVTTVDLWPGGGKIIRLNEAVP